MTNQYRKAGINDSNKETTELINSLSNVTYRKGDEAVSKDGIRYRYDNYTNNYKHTPYWLKLKFEKAMKAVDPKRWYDKNFTDGIYSVFFDRAIYKWEKDGRMSYRVLGYSGSA